MPKYSRTAKYQELRTALQSDSETDVKTNDLSSYEKRLKDITPSSYGSAEGPVPAEKEAVQGRRTAVYDEEDTPSPLVQQTKNPDYSDSYMSNNANYTSAFNNEYLNEYIREVKQYNIDQGNAISANTDLNILKALKGEKPKPPVKPYPDEQETIRVPSNGRYEASAPAQKPKPAPSPVQDIPAAPPVREADTADISFFNNRKPAPPVDFLDEEENENTMQEAPLSDTRTMSKEDIAAEVQRLINGAQQKKAKEEKAAVRRRQTDIYDTDEYDERSTRQQLLNETTQMRAQLDDYEDNLNDVNDKMKKTNQILNIVLIILIIALALVLAVVIYWVFISKGK